MTQGKAEKERGRRTRLTPTEYHEPGMMLDVLYALKITEDAEELRKWALLFSLYAYGDDVGQVFSTAASP